MSNVLAGAHVCVEQCSCRPILESPFMCYGRIQSFTSTAWLTVFLTCTGCANARPFRGIHLSATRPGTLLLVPPIAQESLVFCGPAATCSVLLYYRVPIDRVLATMKAMGTRRPWSALDVVHAARSVGLTAFLFRGTLEDALHRNVVRKRRPMLVLLRRSPRISDYPCFAWFRETISMLTAPPHWVVLVGQTADRRLILLDPLNGYVVMKRKDFMTDWTALGSICVLIGPASATQPRTGRGSHQVYHEEEDHQ